MKTNSLKKAFAALAISAVAVSATSISAFAANDVKGPDNGFTADEIAASAIKPTVSVDRVTLSLAEAQEHVDKDTPVSVSVNVEGANNLYGPTGFHIDYDTRLSIVKGRTQKPDIKLGDGGADLALTTEEYPGGVFCTTSADGDFGFDGVLYTLQFKIPSNFAAGDVYPVEIIYRSASNAMDRFTNSTDDAAGKLMQGYVFTQGIVQGYIQIEGSTTTTTAPTTTTATTAPTTTTTATTAPTTTASTTAATTTAATTTAATTTAATTAPTTTTTGDGSTTTTTTSTTTTTTTTTSSTSKDNGKTNNSSTSSPKTGVAGVGVAAAGLAVAIGTAFVLRKKND